MRLWTFQARNAGETLLDGSVWYNSFGYRTKDEDQQYVTEDETNKQKRYPIYCFSRIMRSNGLSLRTMISAYDHLDRYYKLNLNQTGRVLIELEVPDSAILNCKMCFVEEGSTYVEHTDFLKYVRKTEEDTECVLAEIRPEWVVAVRKFYQYDSCWKCVTVYHNDTLNPAWTDDVYADSGYPGEKVDKKFVPYSAKEDIEAYYNKHCMSGCPKYFTLLEVDNCCDGQTNEIIWGYAEKKGYSVIQVRSMSVDELFDHRLK